MSLLTILRPATKKDCQAIYDIHLHAVQYVCIRSYDKAVIHAWESLPDINSYLETISNKNKALRVVEHKGLIQGFSQVDFREARLDALYVHPLSHNLGLGAALFSRAKEMVRNAGLSLLKLYALLNSVPLYRLNRYESLGTAVLQLNKTVRVECEPIRRYLQPPLPLSLFRKKPVLRIATPSDHLVNQIAVGGVVERPANVLREIVENSIDAGATATDVELAGGGIRLIRVSDNGSGIHPDDIELALHRHATSKIRTLNNLEHVASTGFRSEGLASITSVSRLTLTSRQDGSAYATQVKVGDGKLGSPTVAAHPIGTIIEAAELFFNTPARRKSLKFGNTEYVHCTTMFERLTLARPCIAFPLKCDGKPVLKPPAQSPHGRIAAIVSDDFQTVSLEVDSGSGALRLYGTTAKPTLAKGKIDKQYRFVSHRFVRNKVMPHAVKQAYRNVLYNVLAPVFALSLDLPPEAVDANVHPTKTEICFRDSQQVHQLVPHTLNKVLADTRADLTESVSNTGEVLHGIIGIMPVPVSFENSSKNLFDDVSNYPTGDRFDTCNASGLSGKTAPMSYQAARMP